MTMRRSGSERREEIVAAYLALAAEGDPGRITTGQVAARVGVTQGALFRHFAGKEAMVEAVVERVADGLMGAVGGVLEDVEPGEELAALGRAFLAHAAFVDRHPGGPRVILSELQHAGATGALRAAGDLMRRYRELVERVMRRGCSADVLRSDLNVQVASGLYLGALQGLLFQTLVGGRAASVSKAAPAAWGVLRVAFAGGEVQE